MGMRRKLKADLRKRKEELKKEEEKEEEDYYDYDTGYADDDEDSEDDDGSDDEYYWGNQREKELLWSYYERVYPDPDNGSGDLKTDHRKDEEANGDLNVTLPIQEMQAYTFSETRHWHEKAGKYVKILIKAVTQDTQKTKLIGTRHWCEKTGKYVKILEKPDTQDTQKTKLIGVDRKKEDLEMIIKQLDISNEVLENKYKELQRKMDSRNCEYDSLKERMENKVKTIKRQAEIEKEENKAVRKLAANPFVALFPNIRAAESYIQQQPLQPVQQQQLQLVQQPLLLLPKQQPLFPVHPSILQQQTHSGQVLCLETNDALKRHITAPVLRIKKIHIDRSLLIVEDGLQKRQLNMGECFVRKEGVG